MPYQYGHRVVAYPMTNGVHIAYFLGGFATCGLAWLIWPIHAIAISGRTRIEYEQTWTPDGTSTGQIP